MQVKDYFDKVEMYIDSLTDPEFENLLIEAGLNSCLVDVNVYHLVEKLKQLNGEKSGCPE